MYDVAVLLRDAKKIFEIIKSINLDMKILTINIEYTSSPTSVQIKGQTYRWLVVVSNVSSKKGETVFRRISETPKDPKNKRRKPDK